MNFFNVKTQLIIFPYDFKLSNINKLFINLLDDYEKVGINFKTDHSTYDDFIEDIKDNVPIIELHNENKNLSIIIGKNKIDISWINKDVKEVHLAEIKKQYSLIKKFIEIGGIKTIGYVTSNFLPSEQSNLKEKFINNLYHPDLNNMLLILNYKKNLSIGKKSISFNKNITIEQGLLHVDKNESKPGYLFKCDLNNLNEYIQNHKLEDEEVNSLIINFHNNNNFSKLKDFIDGKGQN